MTLAAEAVELRFGAVAVLSGVSVAVSPGRITALAGPNGAGKSSLLRVMSGEVKPTGGAMWIDGLPLDGIDPWELAVRRSVMLQAGLMAFDYYVEEVLEMGWTGGGEAASFQGSLTEVVERCRIGALVGRKFNTLSGGERQRVHFARALLQVWRAGSGSGCAKNGSAPRYMLLDEPTAGLDLAHELLVLRLARRASEGDTGVLVVLHDLNLVARFADLVVLMENGTVRAAGSPTEVFTENLLSQVYQTPVRIERHGRLDRLVVHTE